jgi:hypothetical protein
MNLASSLRHRAEPLNLPRSAADKGSSLGARAFTMHPIKAPQSLVHVAGETLDVSTRQASDNVSTQSAAT